jgi:hypothetical protein
MLSRRVYQACSLVNLSDSMGCQSVARRLALSHEDERKRNIQSRHTHSRALNEAIKSEGIQATSVVYKRKNGPLLTMHMDVTKSLAPERFASA